ncbi:MAG: translation elongation factor Ts [Cyclobacteriaceae bacterium]|nr:translation elongation factor Ts [Cyclobacteriaceae bacterium]
MAITAKEVNTLRQMTGAGMMDCKKALVEADGDYEKAIEILRKKGQKVSASRADRDAKEGAVLVMTNDDKTEGVLIALNCETDFVGKNADFLGLGEDILKVAFESNPSSKEDLLTAKLGDLTIGEKITEFIGKIGEKIEVSAYVRMQGEAVIPYIHAGNKLGVLVALQGTGGNDVEQAGKDVGMQIAAMSPIAVNKDSVDQSVIEKELEIGREQARAEGKPDQIIDKIAQGKLQKFFKDSTLLEQAFVKDSSLTVGKYLNTVVNGLTVTQFERVSIG